MHAHRREAAGGLAYARHRPEDTRLYRLVEQHFPAFAEHLAEQGKVLPAYIDKEFAAYLKCGRLEHGFLRARCASCHFERLVAFSCQPKKSAIERRAAMARAQRLKRVCMRHIDVPQPCVAT